MLERLKASAYDLILLDVRLPDMDGLDAIPRCRELAPDTPIIVMTAHGTRQTAMDAIMQGAYDFFTKPLKMDEFQVVVSRALDRRRLQKQVKALRDSQPGGLEGLIGQSEALKRVVDMAHRAAPTDLTVLIQGESGTGKEVLARAIHRLSTRKDGPFVPVNCAAIPEGLLESELFGHERGAFTGAVRARPGRFELAKEGTLFLDEIGDMPLTMQAKILRVLQEREFERVGGTRTMTADVRVIAATHRDLEAAVAQGSFQQDLFYRLQGVGIVLPPLHERVDDLPLLATHLLERAPQRLNRQPAVLSPEALRCLWTYQWPGNVRELQHVLEGAMVLSDGVIRPDHLPPAVQRAAQARPAAETPVPSGSLDEALEEWERRMILDALHRTHGVQARAAKILGVSERRLWYRIKKLGIQVRTPDDAPPA
jgi:two-component system, NtrC family, response regulator AtoC